MRNTRPEYRNKLTLEHARYLEATFPLQLFATLTFPGQVSEEFANRHFDLWADRIQADYGMSISWILGLERRPSRHLHAAVVAPFYIEPLRCADRWREVTFQRRPSAAMVERYRPELNGAGLSYIAKAVEEHGCEVTYGKYLEFFVRKPHKDWPRPEWTPRKRRAWKRIDDQRRRCEKRD